MKKKIIIIILLLIISIVGGINLYKFIRVKTAKIEIDLKDNLNINFNEDVRVSDFIDSINGKIINDYLIDTSELGKKIVEFSFINEQGIKLKYKFNVNIVDTKEPVIWLNTSYRVKKGNTFKASDILCGDDYDPEPNCYIEGEYNTDKVGEYPLVYKAIDSSGNMNEEKFILKVYEPKPSTGSSSKVDTIKFSDVVKEYKTSNIKIGIDVSAWQGDIDFAKLKNAGVEFIIIRVGGTKGTNGEYFLDKKFIQNISGANKYNIPVGLYFYSYANSRESAIKDAKWVREQIKNYKVDLPIAFDWEEWSSFNEYNLSFFELSKISEVFLETLSKYGYKGMLYSSKSYLEYIWFPTDYDIWLAHYTKDTDYKGKYRFWQLCDIGRVDGIKGNVDIDIMYY